jgi:hypothetical protein
MAKTFALWGIGFQSSMISLDIGLAETLAWYWGQS